CTTTNQETARPSDHNVCENEQCVSKSGGGSTSQCQQDTDCTGETSTVTANLVAGETTTCTFYDVKTSLKIVKKTEGGDGKFNFELKSSNGETIAKPVIQTSGGIGEKTGVMKPKP